MINVSVIKTKKELDSFLSGMDWSSIAYHPVHVSKSWLTSWCKYFSNVIDSFFFCIHTYNNNVIAVYPLYLKRVTLGLELRFIGSGESEIAEVCSEFQDFIIHDNFIDESLRRFTEQINQLSGCTKIAFEHIQAHSQCYRWLKTLNRTFWVLQSRSYASRFTVSIQNNVHEQIKALTQSTLRRQARRVIEREDIKVIYCENSSQIQDFMTLLADIHTSQWTSRGQTGAFVTDEFKSFHHEFSTTLLKEHRLLLFKMVSQNFCIAVFYGFYHLDTLYYYQSGISNLSPLSNTGIAMHLAAMNHARERNISCYDLMAGKPNSYKSHYTKPTSEVLSVEYVNIALLLAQSITRTANLLLKIMKKTLKH